jgi:hypothetical protein
LAKTSILALIAADDRDFDLPNLIAAADRPVRDPVSAA